MLDYFFSTLIIVALLFVCGICQDADADADSAVTSDDESVYTLTTENFDEFISSHARVLVEFYAPWCGHCKALAPEYESAATALHSDPAIDTYLAKVDATESKELATKYGVSGFPTLKYFTGDVESPDDYSGGRTEATIVSWIRSRSLPPVAHLTSLKEIEEFKSSSRVVLIAFIEEESEGVNALQTFAEANRESVVVGQVSLPDLNVPGIDFNNVYMFRDFGDEKVVKMEVAEELDAESLAVFFNAERFPLIDAIGPENYKDYMDRGLPLVWISLQPEDTDMYDAVIKALTPHAANFKGRLSFTWVDAVKFAQHVQNLGITSTPGVLIVGEKKFLYRGDVSNEDDLQTFFDGYEAGTIDAHLKSEDIPESNVEDVFVLVGKQFDDVVGSEKDVFVEYYAPWCGHCKRLAPEYEQVGAAFADVSDLIIAKIDATENDTPEDIKGFPTLIFYPAGTKVPNGVKFTGDRKADAIIDWIKEAATVDISGVKTEL